MVVSEVLDIAAGSEPTLAAFLISLSRVDARLHSVIKERVCLEHIDDVYLDFSLGWQPLHLEVKPLGVSFGVYIVLKYQVIFVLLNLINSEKIA